MLEEKDYYAALGVEQPGEKEQEAAGPVEAQPAEAVSDTPTGEQVQEPAEPAEIETQEVQTGGRNRRRAGGTGWQPGRKKA